MAITAINNCRNSQYIASANGKFVCGECLISETSPSPMAILPIPEVFKASVFLLLGFFPED